MASTRPIPKPPATPTPPPDGQAEGLGLENVPSLLSPSPDPNALSPLQEIFRAPGLSSYSPLSPVHPNVPFQPVQDRYDGVVEVKSPFNFQPGTLTKSPVAKSVGIGQRRGHKYKHSSVSHQIFLEPAPRTPLTVPNSLPVPTLRECWRSMSGEQYTRFWWSIFHAAVAAHTLWRASGSLAMTALSHLILYDAFGAMLCVVVDVLSNFDVWKRSSIRHPFGLERVEVLVGFAMSVLLLFMGMDLISHNLQHVLEELGNHEAHLVHDHRRVSLGEVDAAALLAITATVVSALVLKNHARIGKVMRFAYLESLPSILSNPSHFLTITCSSTLVLLPLLSIHVYTWLDRVISGTIAVCMCLLGGRLVHTLGLMLLMSFSGNGVREVIRDIESDPSVSGIEEAKFWQVHYGLCMANLKLRVRDTDDNLTRLRDRITSLVRNRLGGGYGSGGQRWEVSTQLTIEKS